MPEIHALETVNLRKAWPDEARHFFRVAGASLERQAGMGRHLR